MSMNKIHRDSVSYWEKVTNQDQALKQAHPAPANSIFEFYLQKMGINSGDKVLDIGMGFGRFIPHYKVYGAKIFGIDIDPGMVEAAQKKFQESECDIRIGASENTGFEPNFFDCLVCWAVFDELNQYESLMEMNRILKVGGQVLITGKNDSYCFDDIEAFEAEEGARAKGHTNYFTDILNLEFKKFGFQLKFKRYFIKRGDFAKNINVEDKPEKFYEYLFILEKIGEAERSKSCGFPISSTHSKTWLELITQTKFSKNTGRSENRAILLSGVYRSGTTILAQIVGAHPDIFITYDSVKYLRFCLNEFNPIEVRYKELIDDVKRRICGRWKMVFNPEDVVSTIADPSYAECYDRIMASLRDHYKKEAKYYGEKNAVVWSQIPDFLQMFPNGKVIHIFRDPRDTVASFKKMTYEPGFAYLDGAFNCLHAMYTLPIFRDVFGKDSILLLKMEDLIEKPHVQASKICDFLGVEFNEAMLDKNSFKSKDGTAWDNNSAFQTDATGLMTNYRRWNTFLTPAEIIFIELITRPEMLRYGYQLSNHILSQENLHDFLTFTEDPFLKKRYMRWMKTGRGIEGYPSDPKAKENAET